MELLLRWVHNKPDSKVHGANMGPIWGRQDPSGPHVGPMNFAIWDMMIADVLMIITHFVISKHSAGSIYHINQDRFAVITNHSLLYIVNLPSKSINAQMQCRNCDDHGKFISYE